MNSRDETPPGTGAAPVPLELPIAARIAAAVERYGEADTVGRAVGLLAGAHVGDEFLTYVGGEHARGVLDGAPALYWPELWGARTLLYVWDASAAPAVAAGLANQAWRVREMSVRVAIRRVLDVAPQLVILKSDPSPRVRAAAVRGLGVLGGPEHEDAITEILGDADRDVRRAAQEARDAWRARHPRSEVVPAAPLEGESAAT